MAGNVRDWQTDLVASYPDIFHPVGDPPACLGWPEVGDGWRDLLERACARIRAAVLASGGTFHATQIKEKYGTLRFYWDGALSPTADAQVEEAIDLAEARSACTCEICGEEGRLHGPGWLTTRCAAHAEGRRPVETMQRIVESVGTFSAVATTATATPSSKSIRSAPRRTEMAMDWGRDLMLWHPRLFLTMAEEPSRSFGYSRRRYDVPRDRKDWYD